MTRVLATLMLALWVAGCSTIADQPPPDQRSSEPTSNAPKTAEQGGEGSSTAVPSTTDPAAAAPKATEPASWVQFGMVLRVTPSTLPGSDGAMDPAMALEILLDSGASLMVVQAVSQAGRLAVGDRVRILRIGGFTRVTFWPYGNFSAPGANPQ